MKTLTLCLALFASLTLTGCGDDLAFDLHAEVDEFTVPGDPTLYHGRAPLEAGTVPPLELQLDDVLCGVTDQQSVVVVLLQ